MIVVYPAGKERSDGGLFETCREAWHLLSPNSATEQETLGVTALKRCDKEWKKRTGFSPGGP